MFVFIARKIMFKVTNLIENIVKKFIALDNTKED